MLSTIAKEVHIFIKEQLIQGEENIYEEFYQSVTEYLSIGINDEWFLPSMMLIKLFDMFKNIKTLKFNFDVELNESEINQKIHLPKLKELEIQKIS